MREWSLEETQAEHRQPQTPSRETRTVENHSVPDEGVAEDSEMPTNLFEMRTEHCLIHSSATRRQTELVAAAAKALCRAYPRALSGLAGFDGQVATLRLRLYRDRAEFRRLCKVTDWAEAVYQGSTCHAYISAEASTAQATWPRSPTGERSRVSSGTSVRSNGSRRSGAATCSA